MLVEEQAKIVWGLAGWLVIIHSDYHEIQLLLHPRAVFKYAWNGPVAAWFIPHLSFPGVRFL
jgi:hypothetical protein